MALLFSISGTAPKTAGQYVEFGRAIKLVFSSFILFYDTVLMCCLSASKGTQSGYQYKNQN